MGRGDLINLYGYRRENGKFGIRNHVAVIPTSICSSVTAARISNLVEGTVVLPHGHGCCQVGDDYDQTVRTLIGLGKNPNVAAVLVVALGCEGVQPELVVNGIRESGKTVEQIIIQQSGGTLKAIEEGVKKLRKMVQDASRLKREKFEINKLILGLECGGTDATSGITANPVAGRVSDLLLAEGGTTILSETIEIVGAEHLLAKRAVNEEIGRQLLSCVKRAEERALSMCVDINGSQPTPGNIEGGVTTIEEKSLGCIYKAGTAKLAGVLEYAEQPESNGLYFMDTPGQDIESITGMLSGGAHIVIFTTGRGTPTGSPIAPVIKVTGNNSTYTIMQDNIDFNVGKIITEDVSIEDMAQALFQEMLDVCNGKLTKAELLKHHEFGIYKIGYTF